MTTRIRWGIMGTGLIARLFASDLSLVRRDAVVAAIGSRSQDRADAFGMQFNVRHRYGSYEELVESPEVDIVYVATPNHVHKSLSVLALDHGKFVLCEKPFTLNATEAHEVVAKARERSVFLMEGMWTRFFPAMTKLRKWISEGHIGEVVSVQASFGFRTPNRPEDRHLNAMFGGGALLDVGVYPLSLCSMLFGPPATVSAIGRLGESGVDEQTAIILGYGGGQLATLACALTARTPQDAFVIGTRGYIQIVEPFWRPTRLVLRRTGGSDNGPKEQLRRSAVGTFGRNTRKWLLSKGSVGARGAQMLRDFGLLAMNTYNKRSERFPVPGWGLHYEAAEAMRCVRKGLLESPDMPWTESLQIMRTMDDIRAQIGLDYPGSSESRH